MKRHMTISVVTPSYNQGRFIEETIKSVISQAGDFHIEYLIMDGGSRDDSVEIIKKYETLLKEGRWPVRCLGITYKWVSEKDEGQADAVNKGFRASTGEILGWINSDDTYCPGAFANALKHFEAHKEDIMVYGEGFHIKENGELIDRYYTEPFDYARLAEVCYILQPTVFLRRRVLDETGFLNKELHYCMDYEYWIRIGKRFKIGYTSAPMANFRVYPETKTMSRRLEIHREIIMVINGNFGYVPINWVVVFADEYANKLFKRRNILFLIYRDIVFKFLFARFNRHKISTLKLIKFFCTKKKSD